MNKDISSDGSGHLLGSNGFHAFYLNSKVFLLPRPFMAGLSLRARLGYLSVAILAFVSRVTIWTSADDYIKLTISLLLCDFQA